MKNNDNLYTIKFYEKFDNLTTNTDVYSIDIKSFKELSKVIDNDNNYLPERMLSVVKFVKDYNPCNVMIVRIDGHVVYTGQLEINEEINTISYTDIKKAIIKDSEIIRISINKFINEINVFN